MNAKESRGVGFSGSGAYLLLFVPALLAAVVHWIFMERFAAAVGKELGGVAFPQLTGWVIQSGPVVYGVACGIVALAVLSRWFEMLRRPFTVGGMGAVLACGLYVYGIGTMLPLITLMDMHAMDGAHGRKESDSGLPDRRAGAGN